jgi:hypothetical protein
LKKHSQIVEKYVSGIQKTELGVEKSSWIFQSTGVVY